MAARVKEIQRTGGPALSLQFETRLGRPLDDEIANRVKSFFNDDEISNPIGGVKNTVVVSYEDSEMEHTIVARRRMVISLEEAFEVYKSLHPNDQIGRTRFMASRPAEVLTMAKSTKHIFGLCVTCTNSNLMFKSVKDLDVNEAYHLAVCEPSTLNEDQRLACVKGHCSKCNEQTALKNALSDLLGLADTTSAKSEHTYKNWCVSASECNYESIKTTRTAFLKTALNSVKVYKAHRYVADSQKQYITKLKTELGENELIVHMDFAENMECMIQDEVSPKYFKRTHISLFIAVCYKRVNGKLLHQSYAIVSDDLTHDLSYVILSLKTIRDQEETTKEFPDSIPGNVFDGILKVRYISDGARQHFKSKNAMWFLSHHNALFGCPATWTFFASGHGKGACDGVGGTLKLALKRYALNENRVTEDKSHMVADAKAIFDWQKERRIQPRTTIGLINEGQMKRFRDEFKDRIHGGGAARPIPQITAYHFFEYLTPPRPRAVSPYSTDHKLQ